MLRWVSVNNIVKINLSIIVVMSMCLSIALNATAQTPQSDNASLERQRLFAKAQLFSAIYEPELGVARPCEEAFKNGIKVCFDTLKNDGNSPYILLPNLSVNQPQPRAVVVLFHGLSDSPYFVSSIAEFLRLKGYVVIAPLTPGHGKIDADADMQDDALKARWYAHTNTVMQFAKEMAGESSLPVVIGGFSTGGALATYYTLTQPNDVAALLLFSGALEIGGSAETMAKVWGMKTLAKFLDGEYETQGAHPFKYPSVATYSGLVLIDVVRDIRDILANKTLSKPIFAAHSMDDNVTLFDGIKTLTDKVQGRHTIFKIDESYELCHADLPMNSVQIVNLTFDKSKINESEKCAVPKANPLHAQMLMMLEEFLTQRLPS